ncbi:ABC transporter substrate-binding protein [Pseudalkalibacillus salsuginis]|uniref:ABC transporter substrate-binding protein n=1 Tax=Pseudalkalibacillus salsuginis TaxID=2910972 RepID=UPI001F1D0C76|nr:ABC transporter substrate-binding protein [Pseudalkalibacillus salsuginis]MCF6412003.1 ABC transporter substrate-binding protein [Pseudalkalibacillus salsuginis]
MKKGYLWALAIIMIVSVALAGCNSDSGSDGDNGSGDSEKEQTLIFGRGGDSVGLDPATVTDGESFKVIKNVYDTLVEYGEQDTEINPSLAEEWDVSGDGLTYTFKLREGVKFHNGDDFNAEAVVKNFERWMNSGDAGKFAYYASMFGGFKGDEGHVIKSVEAKDENTVVFTLNRPQAPFLKNLAMTPFSIGAPSEFDNLETQPVGTGPFKFVDWKRNDRITLEKNEDYFKEGLPKLDKVIFRAIPDNSNRLNALKTGEVHLIDGVNPSDVAEIEQAEELKPFFRPSMNVGYLGFNTEMEPFNDKKVRQALNHAVDKDALIKAFYEGQAEPAKNPMPPVINGYNDEIDPYPFDLEKAKELLAEAGYEDGFKTELWAMPVPRPYMPDGKKAAEAIAANFAKIGVEAEIVSFEWGTYLEKTQKGEAPMFLLGWTGDNGDADNFLYTLLDKDTIGSNNYSRFANDELHDILIEAQSTPEEDKRAELYKEAQVILHEEAPWVPLVHSEPALAGLKNVEGFKPHPTGSDKLTNVSLSE